MATSTLFVDALDKYHDITGKRLEDLPKVDNADDLIDAIVQQNNDFKHFREKASVLTKTLKYAVMPLETVGNLASGAASAAFPPSTMIFGAVMYLIGAAKGVSASLDAIEEMFSQLKEFTTRLSIYDRSDLSTEMKDKLTDILVVLIEIIAISTKKVKNGFTARIKSLSRNILLGNDSSMTALLSKLNKLTASEGQIVLAETFVESKEVGKGVKDIQTGIADQSARLQGLTIDTHHIAAGVDELLASAKRRHQHVAIESLEEIRKKVKAILNPSITATERFEQIKRERLSDSGDWILSERALLSWRNSQDSHILWIQGTPGAGKSFLAYHIIEWLNDRDVLNEDGQAMKSGAVAYYFFRDNSASTRSVLQALKDLASQISQSVSAYSRYLVSRLDSETDISSIRVAWVKLFAEYWLKSDRDAYTYLVIDGLDEADDEERTVLFELLEDLESSNQHKLKIAMTGRPHVYDELRERISNPLSIHINATMNSRDISRYIDDSISKSRILRSLPEATKNKVIMTLEDKAGGMFMWVKLMIADLSKRSKVSSIEKALSEAPKGLNEMFRHTLEGFSARLSEDDVDDLNTILTWTCLANRPLRLEELEFLASTEENEPILGLGPKLLTQYGAFFHLSFIWNDYETVEEQDLFVSDSPCTSDDEAQAGYKATPRYHLAPVQVMLSHASISDYFRTNSGTVVQAAGSSAGVGFDTQQGHARLLRGCLMAIRAKLQGPEETDESQKQSISGLLTDRLGYVVGSTSNKQTAYKGPEQFGPSYTTEHWLHHLSHVSQADFNDHDLETIRTTIVSVMTGTEWWDIWPYPKFFAYVNVEIADRLTSWLVPRAVTPLQTYELGWVDDLTSGRVQSLDVYWYWMRRLANLWLTFEDPRVFSARFAPGAIIVDWLKLKGVFTAQHDPVDYVITAAKWFGHEMNAEWYTCVARTLKIIQADKLAIEWYEAALQLDSDQGTALHNLASLHRSENAHESAIELELRLLSVAGTIQDFAQPDLGSNVTGSCYDRIGDDYLVLLKRPFSSTDQPWFIPDAAIIQGLEDRESNSLIYDRGGQRAVALVLALSTIARQKLMVLPDEPSVYRKSFQDLLRFVHKFETHGDDYPSELMDRIFDQSSYGQSVPDEDEPDLLPHVALAACHCKELDWLRSSTQAMIQEAQQCDDVFKAARLTSRLANLNFAYASSLQEQEEALHMLESVLDMELYELVEESAEETAVVESENDVANDGASSNIENDDMLHSQSHGVQKTNNREGEDDENLPSDAATDVDGNGDIQDPRVMAMAVLGQNYSVMAVADTAHQDQYVHKLRDLLARCEKMMLAGEQQFIASSLILKSLLAPWLNRDGLGDSQEKKAMLRSMLELLLPVTQFYKEPTDQQRDEYRASLTLIAILLFAAGDVRKSTALLLTIRSYHHGWAEDSVSKHYPRSATSSRYKAAWECAGPCLRSFNSFDGCNQCTMGHMNFCDDCIRLIQDDRTPFTGLCNKEHKFYRVPELDTPLYWGQVPTDDGNVDFKDFKRGLMKDWGIDHETDEHTNDEQKGDAQAFDGHPSDEQKNEEQKNDEQKNDQDKNDQEKNDEQEKFWFDMADV